MGTRGNLLRLVWMGVLMVIACSPGTGKWEYVSMGGDFTYSMRWNEIYASYLEEDLGVEVTLTDVSFHSRKTLADMLEQLQTDQEYRTLVENAEVITFDVPTESYVGGAQGKYMSGICGGEDKQQCFTGAHDRTISEPRAYLEELTSLANSSDAIVRTFVWGTMDARLFGWGTGLPEEEMRIFIQHTSLLAESIREIATEFNIQVIDIASAYQPDGLDMPPSDRHVGRTGMTDEAVQVVADLLREAGYALLRP